MPIITRNKLNKISECSQKEHGLHEKDKSRRIWLFFIFLTLSGCAPTHTVINQASDIGNNRLLAIKEYTAGTSAKGIPIMYYIMGNGDDVLLMVASIHGNESAGTPLLFELMAELRRKPEKLDRKTLVLLPIANPDGYISNTRWNANGVDLNRNFPTANRINNSRFGFYPMSEPESAALVRIINSVKPDRIISFHQPTNCIDYDGPAACFADYLSWFCDMPKHKIGALPGSLGSYAGEELGIPIITVEFPAMSNDLSSRELWLRYRSLFMAAVQYPNHQPGNMIAFEDDYDCCNENKKDQERQTIGK